jgi:hypothetical protein
MRPICPTANHVEAQSANRKRSIGLRRGQSSAPRAQRLKGLAADECGWTRMRISVDSHAEPKKQPRDDDVLDVLEAARMPVIRVRTSNVLRHARARFGDRSIYRAVVTRLLGATKRKTHDSRSRPTLLNLRGPVSPSLALCARDIQRRGCLSPTTQRKPCDLAAGKAWNEFFGVVC